MRSHGYTTTIITLLSRCSLSKVDPVFPVLPTASQQWGAGVKQPRYRLRGTETVMECNSGGEFPY